MFNKDKEIEVYPSTNKLAKRGVTAVGGIIGGVALLAMSALPPVAGIIVGGAATAIGIGAVLSKDPDDKKIGKFVVAGGVLALVSKLPIPAFIAGVAGTVLSIGGLGLLGMGIWNGIKFIKGLKSRS